MLTSIKKLPYDKTPVSVLELQRSNNIGGKYIGFTYWSINRNILWHITDNIYIPNINFYKKSQFYNIGYRETLDYWSWIADSWIDVFDNRCGTTRGKYVYSLLVTNDQALKIINKLNINNGICTYNLISGKIYYDNAPQIKKIYPTNYNAIIKNQLLLILKSDVPTLRDSYLLLDNFINYNQDIINKLTISKNAISKLYGFIDRDDLNIIIFIIKMLNDYNVLYKLENISLSNITSLIKDTCVSIDRCGDKNMANTYKKILCNDTLIKRILPKLEIFYKLIISTNPDNMLKQIHKNIASLYQIWNTVKYSNLNKLTYNKEYLDTSC